MSGIRYQRVALVIPLRCMSRKVITDSTDVSDATTLDKYAAITVERLIVDDTLLHLLFSLRNLKELRITGKRLSHIPTTINVSSSQITKLDMSGNHLGCDNIILLKHLPKLVNLSLCDCQLINVPAQLNANLTHLDLSANRLELSQELFESQNLKQLRLVGCYLEVIPDFDVNKCKLESLILRKNVIDESSVSKLLSITSLQTLDITSGKHIEKLMFDESSSRLTQFSVDWNGLGQPALNSIFNIRIFKEMKVIKLAGTGLLYTPKLRSSMITCVYLNDNAGLNTNELTSVFHLENATIISISNCGIKQLPEFNPELSQAEVMFKGNQLDQRSIDLLFRMPRIRNETELKYEGYNLLHVPNLPLDCCAKSINFKNNKFEDSVGLSSVFQLSQLENLDICYCGIKSLPNFDPQQLKVNCLFRGNDLDQWSINLLFQLPRIQELENWDYSNHNLMFVPNVNENSQTKQINLSFNQFVDVSGLKSVFSLYQVNQIDISHCNLQSLPDFNPEFCTADVNFKGNKLDQRSIDMMFSLPKIRCKTELNYENYGLINVPNVLPDLCATSINFRQNKFKNSDGLISIFLLNRLDNLNLQECDIQSLPSNIEPQSCQIKVLSMNCSALDAQSKNILLQLPHISGCMDLRQPNSNKQRQKLFPNFPITSQVNKVVLSGQDLSDATTISSIFQLQSLISLEIDNCCIKHILSFDISQCKLTHLYAGQNELSDETADLLINIPSLEHIQMQKCGLARVPKLNLETQHKLITLKLGGNPFKNTEQLPSILLYKSIQELHIEDCGIENIPDFNPLDCFIKKLAFYGNKFNQTSINLIFNTRTIIESPAIRYRNYGLKYFPRFSKDAKVEVLSLRENKFTNVDEIASIFNLQSLYELDIQDCSITTLPDQVITYMSQLKYLYIKNNNFDLKSLNLISQSFLFDRQSSDWSDLQIKFVPRFCDSVVQLSLRGNSFENSSGLLEMFRLPKLSSVDLSNCNIAALPQFQDVFPNMCVSQLQDVSMRSNKFQGGTFKSLALIFSIPSVKLLNLMDVEVDFRMVCGGLNLVELKANKNKIDPNIFPSLKKFGTYNYYSDNVENSIKYESHQENELRFQQRRLGLHSRLLKLSNKQKQQVEFQQQFTVRFASNLCNLKQFCLDFVDQLEKESKQ